MEIIAIIPARSGSKGIPHKNIRPFHGKPLMAHSIEQALKSRVASRVIVSTDCPEYAGIARECGAEVPFLRPAAIAADESTDLQTFIHALEWLAEHEQCRPEICIHLRPTHPNRTPEQIREAVELLRKHPAWDSVRSVVPAPETPFKMWFMSEGGLLSPIVNCQIPEAHSTPRQLLPPAFLQNACIDVIRSRTILSLRSMAGSHIGAYLMRENHDIDTPEQLAASSRAFRDGNQSLPTGKTFVFDIDGVIASLTSGNDYTLARPLSDNIARINRLHGAGNRIILFTARGFVTGKEWTTVTQHQMSEWGVLHHELRFGKPAADYYVDDKMMSLEELQAIDNVEN